MKTSNAYRSIPFHGELEQLIRARRRVVEELYDGDIGQLPVCCIGNDIHQPCRDFEVAILTQQVLDEIGLTQQDLYIYQVESLAEQEFSEAGIAEKGQHLTLYVLRRNFWTWLAWGTQMDDMEKRLIMGHEMVVNGHNYRPDYNSEALLWSIAQRMDRCVINSKLHRQLVTLEIDDTPQIIHNRGIAIVTLNSDQIQKGCVLEIVATTEEPIDTIGFQLIEGRDYIDPPSMKLEVTGEPQIGTQNPGINTEYDNWCAHVIARNRSKPRKPSTAKDETTDSDPTD